MRICEEDEAVDPTKTSTKSRSKEMQFDAWCGAKADMMMKTVTEIRYDSERRKPV